MLGRGQRQIRFSSCFVAATSRCPSALRIVSEPRAATSWTNGAGALPMVNHCPKSLISNRCTEPPMGAMWWNLPSC